MHSPLPQITGTQSHTGLRLQAWARASRPLAVAVLWPPALAAACVSGVPGGVDLGAWATLAIALVSLQGVILFGNDLADHQGDAGNPSPPPWSGGSRVLVEGLLSRRQLTGGLIVAATVFVAATIPGPARWWAFACITAAALYDLPGIRLSHRPAGALLQGVGLGILVPGLTIRLLGSDPLALPWHLWVPGILLGTAQGIASALPDQLADQRVGKRTWAVAFGGPRATADTGTMIAMATIAIAVMAHWGDAPPLTWATLAGSIAMTLAPTSTPRNHSLALGAAILLGWVAYSLTLSSPASHSSPA